MKNILVVEDNQIQAMGLKKLISSYYPHSSVFVAYDAASATKIFNEHSIDLFILDVKLSDDQTSPDGIDLGINIRNIKDYQTTPIVYITSYKDKVYRAVNDTHCYKFLEKPYTKDDLYNTLADVDKFISSSAPSITIKDNRGGKYLIALNDIMVISSEGHTIKICTTTRKHSTNMSLKEFSELLPKNFVQTHKSHIVNLDYIKSYDKTSRTISVNNLYFLTVGKSYKHNFDKIMEG